jgi:hypothetical protein
VTDPSQPSVDDDDDDDDGGGDLSVYGSTALLLALGRFSVS